VQAIVNESASKLSEAELEEAITAVLGPAQRTQSASDAEARVRAEQVARTRLGAKPASIAKESAKALVTALRKATPRLTVMR
jgi:hypothetical protein